MVDIHSHILPGVDDGPSTMELVQSILAEAQKAGVKMIIATPHYSRELHENGMVEQVFDAVRSEALRFGIELLKGYEIKIRHLPARMPADFSDLDLAGTRFVLLEMPLDRVPSYAPELIYNLQIKGFVPILAHPERCRKMAMNMEMLDGFYEAGCLIQVDASSIIGVNGWRARCFARKLIKKDKASFVASDAHSPEGYSVWYRKAYEKVVKWTNNDKADDLFNNNAASIFSQTVAGSQEVAGQ
jgi:protein-tyrosine phosphatase